MSAQAVILAGGLGSRMRPRTLRLPKSLLQVAGRAVIDWQLERLAAQGFSSVVICISHLGKKIREHLQGRNDWGLSLDFSDEGSRLLGTGGALRAALKILEPTFVVTYGDSLLPFDYGTPLRLLNERPSDAAVMSVFRNKGRWERSNVQLEGDRVRCYNKGATADSAFDYIDYGAIALRRTVVERIPSGEKCELGDALEELAEAGTMSACIARERFYEVGSPDGLAALELRLREGPLP